MNFTIRLLQPQDNAAIAALIRSVMTEHGVPQIGSAYADPELNALSEFYDQPQSSYFVAASEGEIIGGAGIAPLKGGDRDTCELQKMYLLDRWRGKGVGRALMHACLAAASQFGFSQCYLETMPNMYAAQKLYAQSGFVALAAPMGNTCHSACPVWMVKKLQAR